MMYDKERQKGERVAIQCTPSLTTIEASRTTIFVYTDLNRRKSVLGTYTYMSRV